MRTSKYLIFIISIILFTQICFLPASASSAEFSLSANYSKLKPGDTFEVKVAVNNIEDDAGIVLVEYYLHYDHTCFELKEWKINRPEKWGNDYEDMATIWDKDKNDVYFKCAYLYKGTELNHGILDDGVLYTTIIFEVLSEEADGKEMRLDNTSVMTDNNEIIKCDATSHAIILDKHDVYNIWKIVISVLALIIIAGIGIFIEKYTKNKK